MGITMSRVTMVCVAYKKPIEIQVLVSSMIAQTFKDWQLVILHDGVEGVTDVDAAVCKFRDSRIELHHTGRRYNDYGHSLREMSLIYCRGLLIGHTNDDNYYAPVYLEKMIEAIDSTPADFAYCNMVHSHQNYSPFETRPCCTAIDAGGWICKREFLPEKWADKGFNGDGVYVEQIMAAGAKPVKVPGYYFVHN
jgi:hypothetical protein